MIRKISIIVFTTLALTLNASAGTDGKLLLSKNDPSKVKDCFEGLNRATFKLNQSLDKVIFKPLAKGYKIIPSPIRSGVSNSLDNLSSLVTIPNNILQGEFKEAGVNTGRFVVNTTLGVLGIFDVASGLGFVEYVKEDYGQSLGTMGVGPGCYVVLPVLGPSTTRDVVGQLTNVVGGDAWYNVTVRNDTQHFKDSDYYISRGGSGIDFRAKNLSAIDNLEKNSVDFYASVKSLYLQDRQQKISNSDVIIETQNDSDWEEIETQ